MVGRIACSKSGRDKGYFLVVIKEENGFLYVADGKERPLNNPKKKNPKHLSLTNRYLSETDLRNDRSLRRALAIYRDTV